MNKEEERERFARSKIRVKMSLVFPVLLLIAAVRAQSGGCLSVRFCLCHRHRHHYRLSSACALTGRLACAQQVNSGNVCACAGKPADNKYFLTAFDDGGGSSSCACGSCHQYVRCHGCVREKSSLISPRAGRVLWRRQEPLVSIGARHLCGAVWCVRCGAVRCAVRCVLDAFGGRAVVLRLCCEKTRFSLSRSRW